MQHLIRYYDTSSDYAGASFVEVLPIAPDAITAADLFAVTLLSVRPARPYRARQLLDEGPARSELDRLLAAAELGVEADLRYADDDTMQAMSQLYRFIKETLGANPWVTASKLCARKRPQLFPVRDEIVCRHLGLLEYSNFEVDWQVFRALTLHSEIWESLQAVARSARDAGARLDSYPLRWLDVVLWMTASSAA